MKINKIFLILVIITLLGGLLRFYKLSNFPVSLNVDEVSIGYNSYSILLTGKDEYGNPLPLSFRSLNDYKPPLYFYLTAISIFIFGLTEFSVRFPSAFLSTLSIPLFYFIFKKLTDNYKVSLLASFLFALSPWSIAFARTSSEATVANFFMGLGILGLLYFLSGKRYLGMISAICFALSMYTYHSTKLFVPLFIAIILFLYKRQIVLLRTHIILAFVIFVVLITPLFLNTFFGPDITRAQMTVIGNDPQLKQNVNLIEDVQKSGLEFNNLQNINYQNLNIIFHWSRKYLAYFQPSFLSFNSLSMTHPWQIGLGVLYIFELPFLLYGAFTFLRQKNIYMKFLIAWLIIGIIPASLTLSEQHPIRTLIIMPIFPLLSAIGFFELLKVIKGWQRKIFLGLLTIFAIWNFLWAFSVYFLFYPSQRGEGLMEGSREVVEYILANQGSYEKIVFDPNRGLEGPYLVNVPHLYLLFYSKYDPTKYQNIKKEFKENSFVFDKYEIRNIYWPNDRFSKDTLFVGTVWSIPDIDIKKEQILRTIYLKNGREGYRVVVPEGLN